MGWAVGYDDMLKRDVGYGVPAICDDPSCQKEIDRGIAYSCGQGPYGGEKGCGLHFCGNHLFHARGTLVCRRCMNYRKPYSPKPDTDEWVQHKLTDPTWEQWRQENPDWVADQSPQPTAKAKSTEQESAA